MQPNIMDCIGKETDNPNDYVLKKLKTAFNIYFNISGNTPMNMADALCDIYPEPEDGDGSGYEGLQKMLDELDYANNIVLAEQAYREARNAVKKPWWYSLKTALVKHDVDDALEVT